MPQGAPPPDSEDADDGEIDAAYISPLDELSVEPRRHRERTASGLAWVLMATLTGSGVLHYCTLLYLTTHGQATALEQEDKFFGQWLPVVSGLTGSAITYYFTRNKS